MGVHQFRSSPGSGGRIVKFVCKFVGQTPSVQFTQIIHFTGTFSSQNTQRSVNFRHTDGKPLVINFGGSCRANFCDCTG